MEAAEREKVGGREGRAGGGIGRKIGKDGERRSRRRKR